MKTLHPFKVLLKAASLVTVGDWKESKCPPASEEKTASLTKQGVTQKKKDKLLVHGWSWKHSGLWKKCTRMSACSVIPFMPMGKLWGQNKISTCWEVRAQGRDWKQRLTRGLWGWRKYLVSWWWCWLQMQCVHLSKLLQLNAFWKFVLLKYSWFTMLCYFLYSKVTQSFIHIYILFHYGLSQDIQYSALTSIVGTWSILYIIVRHC